MESVRDVLRNGWVKFIGILFALGTLGYVIFLVKDTLVPFVLAFLAAYILDPVVDVLQRRGVPRVLAMTILSSVVLVVVAGGLLLLVLDIQAAIEKARIAEEKQGRPTAEKEADLPGEKPDESATSTDRKQPKPKGEAKTAEEWAKRQLNKLIAYVPERFRSLVRNGLEQLYEYLAPRLRGIAQRADEYLAEAAMSAYRFVFWIVKFAVFLVVTLYLLKDIDRIRAKWASLIPPQYKMDVMRIAKNIDSDLRAFFRGQLLVALTLGVLYFIGFLILGIPYAGPVAAIGGLGNFVPYLGTFLGIIAALVASTSQYGLDVHLLYVILVFAIVQFLEGNLITPKIVGESVGLNPVTIILSIMVFGKLLGFFGILFAVPITSVLRVFALELLPRIGMQTEVALEQSPKHQREGGEPPKEREP